MTNEYHYNDIGIKTLARKIKTSLFLESNKSGTSLDRLITFESATPTEADVSVINVEN